MSSATPVASPLATPVEARDERAGHAVVNPFAGARVRQTSDAGFDALQTVCDRLAGFGADVDLEFVDGFLAALAVLPQPPAEDDWLPVLAGDAFDRAFADPEAAAQALRPLRQRLKVLAVQLDPEALLDDLGMLRLQPALLVWTDADRAAAVADGHADAEDAAALQTGADWASGFLFGWQAFGPAVDDGDSGEAGGELAALLQPLQALSDGPEAGVAATAAPAGPGTSALSAAATPAADATPAAVSGRAASTASMPHDALIDDACFAVQDLRLALLDRIAPPPPRRVAPTPGRNDPCPCGSGRKFKKCHGAAAAIAG